MTPQTSPAPTPGAQTAPDAIFQLAAGFMSAKHLYVANEIGLFETLGDSSATLDELAQRLKIPRRTARIIADAMVAVGLVERHGAAYQNAPVAATYLSRNPAADLRPFLRFWNQISYPRWLTLEEAVRKGKGVFGTMKFTVEEQKTFNEGVEAFSAGGAIALAEHYDFATHHRLADLGGGTGSFLKVIQAKHPALECTLFEIPQAAAVARQRLAGTPFVEKIRIVEGDFFSDPIPEGRDAYLLANIIHGFSPEQITGLLRRIRAAASAGARLLIVDLWTNPTHTEPVFAALMAGEFLVMSGEGDVYSVEDGQDFFRESGWRFVEHRPLMGPASLVIGEATVA